MDLTYHDLAELTKLSEQYQILEPFMKKYKKLSYIEFDYSIVHDLTLFTIEPDLNFGILEEQIETIVKALPAIKQIFAKPFIHLKEQNIILPVESVRIINNSTIQHISSHSELWTDIKDNEIQPAKLLTRTYEDNYGIYENIVFCNVVDTILTFTRNNLRILKELIYTNQTIEINILERVNHLNYFLALGKLHTGYSRSFDSYYGVASRCLNKLQFILNTILPRLKQPVYKKNIKRSKLTKLHKTNILAMHKDYHQVYKLSKYFAKENIEIKKTLQMADLKALLQNYYYFCLSIFIFSIGHFNFTCDENKVNNFLRFTMNFMFKDWKLKIKSVKAMNRYVLSILVEKETNYHMICIPSIERNEDLTQIKEQVLADEYILCTPFEDFGLEISMTSIESFRRIQQLILKAMVLTDQKREDCPFCNHRLHLIEEKSLNGKPIYECMSCRTILSNGFCPTNKKTYPYIKIAGLARTRISGEEWLIRRKREAQMFFRNITEITEDLEIVCPYCNKIHA